VLSVKIPPPPRFSSRRKGVFTVFGVFLILIFFRGGNLFSLGRAPLDLRGVGPPLWGQHSAEFAFFCFLPLFFPRAGGNLALEQDNFLFISSGSVLVVMSLLLMCSFPSYQVWSTFARAPLATKTESSCTFLITARYEPGRGLPFPNLASPLPTKGLPFFSILPPFFFFFYAQAMPLGEALRDLFYPAAS